MFEQLAVRLKKNPDDREQQHGSKPYRGEPEVGCAICGENRSVHCVWPDRFSGFMIPRPAAFQRDAEPMPRKTDKGQ